MTGPIKSEDKDEEVILAYEVSDTLRVVKRHPTKSRSKYGGC